MQLHKILSASLFTLALAASARAHFVWIERDAAGATAAYFGEWIHDVRETEDGYLKLIASPRAFAADGTALAVTRDPRRLVIATEGVGGDVRLADHYQSDTGTTLTHYQAKLGRTETVAKLDLELVPVAADSDTFTLLLRGAPLPAADVVLFTSSGWSRTFKTDAAGKVTLETPWPGQAVVEVGHVEERVGEHAGRAHESIRHVFTLTFDVAAK